MDRPCNPMGYDPDELDRQYNARASVSNCLDYLREYADASARARQALNVSVAVPYGAHPDETLDIFPAATANSPVYVYLHGGYWRALSKDDSSFMAPALHATGATVVAVNYSLAPGVTLDVIVGQCRRALAWIFHHAAQYHGDPARLHVSGSSAGGHLAGMLLAPGWQDDCRIPANVIHSASVISGLFDLRPLVHTHINAWAGLNADSAAALSPQFRLPVENCPLLVAWGAEETAEFKRQSTDYAAAWTRNGFAAQSLEVAHANHFSILLTLQDSNSPLSRAIAGLMGLAIADD
ncbi:MAG TPA: alpha/beta hydrolase [Candidimonas sp.]|nr:alpha/beta hydrolase [Candidimonas sp.]